MAIIITEECINCDACIAECPNNAIYEPDTPWTFGLGTKLEGSITSPSGKSFDAEEEYKPLSREFFYIVSDKCTECEGFFDEPQCSSVCPVDACIHDTNHVETKEQLMAKKVWLHNE